MQLADYFPLFRPVAFSNFYLEKAKVRQTANQSLELPYLMRGK